MCLQKLSGDCNIPKTVPENVFGNKVTTSKSVVPPVAQFEAFSVYEDTAETQNDKEKRKIQPPPAKELPKVNFKSDQVARNDLRPISISKIQERYVKLKNKSNFAQWSGNLFILIFRVPLKEKPKIESFTPSPMSMSLDSSCSHMSIVKSDTKSEENEKKATARTLREQFFHVAEYRQDIYNYMLNIEVC